MKYILIALLVFAGIFMFCCIGGDDEPDWHDDWDWYRDTV